jgi:Rab GDP dissociation inhibitor
LVDGEYDAIIMGTGLTECIVSGLLSVHGKKVLHVDRNNYYGADTASLSLSNLYQKFRGTEPPATIGHSRDWNVDLVPKFIMACGDLVKILLHSKVTRYLEFKSVDGSYVLKDGAIHKVPSTGAEALSSPLMGFFEKRKFRNFLTFLEAYDKTKPATYANGVSLDRMTMRQLYDYYGLDTNTQAFTGHAMALHTTDNYLNEPASTTCDQIRLYAYSVQRYGKSPYIYPIYGLGGLPEGFSRLCAIHGGTFMLNKPVDEVLFDGAGKAWGIRCGNEVAKAKQIIGDPSYFDKSKCRVKARVIRSICILDHPIAGAPEAESLQIIIPFSQVPGRRNDIYVAVVSHAHMVAAAGKYIAIVSTTVETNDPARELAPGLNLLGRILDRFDAVSEVYEPVADGRADNCFISASYDASRCVVIS